MAVVFADSVKAALAGRAVLLRRFLTMEFADGAARVWDGAGYLGEAGYTWAGLGDWISISDFEAPGGGLATTLTVGLSGVPTAMLGDLAGAIIANQDQVAGGELVLGCGVYDVEAQTLLDRIYVLWRGEMGVPEIEIGVETASVSIRAETVFARRAIAPYAYYSLADQQAHYPADVGLEFVPGMVSVDLKWPPA